MAIRIRNLDLNVAGNKRTVGVSLGDITATQDRTVFIAPVSCKLDYVDICSLQAVTATSASSQMVISVIDANAASSIWQSRGTSGTAVTTNDISAAMLYRLTPSSNYDISPGTRIKLTFTQGVSGVMSAVHCQVTYTPLLHRETR